jgi:polyisoprenoid-binding protein YceI
MRGIVMTNRRNSLTALGYTLLIGLHVAAPTAATAQEATSSALKLVSSRVSLAGTSNIHAYTASSTAARIVRLQVANAALGPDAWEHIFKPAALEAFEIAIPAATLASPKEGLDKNMHKALKVTEHPDITFRLSRVEGPEASGVIRGVGILKIAGVEREVVLALKSQRTGANLTVTGEVQLLMTDFGITPPKAMMGMLKTDPKVTVTFETVFGSPLT